MPTFALNFSRPGGQIVAQYYNFLRLGREGYHKIPSACSATAAYLGDALRKTPCFDVIYDGRGGIPAVTWSLKEGAAKGFTLYDLSDRLRSRGWQVPAYSMPADRTDLVVMRALVRHGFSRDLADLLMDDMQRCLDYFAKNPVTHSLTAETASGFSHT